MLLFAKLKKTSPIYTFWRLHNQRAGILHGVPFMINFKSLEYETKELSNLQAKILSQYKENITIEIISESGAKPIETPVVETPVVETPVVETPVVETPVLQEDDKLLPRKRFSTQGR